MTRRQAIVWGELVRDSRGLSSALWSATAVTFPPTGAPARSPLQRLSGSSTTADDCGTPTTLPRTFALAALLLYCRGFDEDHLVAKFEATFERGPHRSYSSKDRHPVRFTRPPEARGGVWLLPRSSAAGIRGRRRRDARRSRRK